MGKGGAVAKAGGATATATEVLINGEYYDVAEFAKKHPGGTVIGFYTGNGIDASQAYNNFHIRSKKANKMLASIPHRAADATSVEATRLPGQSALMKDFDELQKSLVAEGFFEPAPLHVAYRVAEIVLMHAVGLYLLLNNNVALGIIVLGVVSGRCGWLMHEGGHYSLTGDITVDRALQIVLYGVGCGMSGGWWRSNHNKHHSMPQKLGCDVDLDTLPLVAFTEKVVLRVKKIGDALKRWVSVQAYLFPICTTLLVALGWQFYLHPRFIIRRKNLGEGVALLTRYALWTVLITQRFGLAQSALLYLAYNWVASNYIFINFAVSHTHLPIVPKEDTQVDWVRYAAVHTMNVHPGPLGFVNWWMSYLNFQIEHHLFPSMPQFRHPIISARVRKLFEKHGLVYDQRDYITSMKVTFANLDKVGHDIFYG